MQVLLVFGQTAVGKTDFVDNLALCGPIEIINMDMGQLYAPLSIGTAKPNWKQAKTVHHMFDIVSKPENFSVVAYRTMVLQKIKEIRGRGSLPVLVGGSSFYLKSLLFPVDDSLDFDTYSYIDSQKSTTELWQKLYAIDSQRANAIHMHDRFRIERALAIWNATGKKPSLCKSVYAPPFTYTLLFLYRDRSILYSRINERVDQMFREGWLDEVKNLDTSWHSFLQKKKLIGYDELVLHIKDPATYPLEKIVPMIKKRTRVYARKQEIFWNMLASMIEDEHKKRGEKSPAQIVDLTLIDLRLYLKQLLGQVSL